MTLIKKDIVFSKKWFYMYLVCIICLPISISVIPIVVRFFYVEDGLATTEFLKSLPVSKLQQIGARLVLATVLLLIAAIVHTGVFFLLEGNIIFADVIMYIWKGTIFLYLFILLGYHLGYQRTLLGVLPVVYFLF